MTIETADTFPLGYFYISLKVNKDVVLDISENVDHGHHLIVTTDKKEDKTERDTQLWIHQDGFLTNKQYGLVMEVGRPSAIMKFFTNAPDLLHASEMEREDPKKVRDQRFGFCSANGLLYTLSTEGSEVLDFHNQKDEEIGAHIMVEKKEKTSVVEEQATITQRWTLVPADPPHLLDPDDKEENEHKRAGLRAWFGNWHGWNHEDKANVLQQKELEKAHEKVYKEKKSNLGYEVIAGAVAVEAFKMYMEKKENEPNGEKIHFKAAKEAVIGLAAGEAVKMFMERGVQDEQDDESKKAEKQTMMQKMAISAATNYFETKFVQ